MTITGREHNSPTSAARTLSAAPLLRRIDGVGEAGACQLLGVAPETLARWRHGGRIKVDVAERVAARLGLTIADIWFPA